MKWLYYIAPTALSRQFETALMQASWQKEGHWVRGIPYEIYGGLSFSERSEIKDLLAYLRLIANPKDSEALLRIVNVPRRGISDTFLDLATQHNRSAGIPLWNVFEEIASDGIRRSALRAPKTPSRSFVRSDPKIPPINFSKARSPKRSRILSKKSNTKAPSKKR